MYPHFGVTDAKLIYYYVQNEWEYFDLESDPQELVSQYYVPEHQGTIQALKKELIRLRAHYESSDPPGPDLNREGVALGEALNPFEPEPYTSIDEKIDYPIAVIFSGDNIGVFRRYPA